MAGPENRIIIIFVVGVRRGGELHVLTGPRQASLCLLGLRGLRSLCLVGPADRDKHFTFTTLARTHPSVRRSFTLRLRHQFIMPFFNSFFAWVVFASRERLPVVFSHCGDCHLPERNGVENKRPVARPQWSQREKGLWKVSTGSDGGTLALTLDY